VNGVTILCGRSSRAKFLGRWASADLDRPERIGLGAAIQDVWRRPDEASRTGLGGAEPELLKLDGRRPLAVGNFLGWTSAGRSGPPRKDPTGIRPPRLSGDAAARPPARALEAASPHSKSARLTALLAGPLE